MIVTLPGHIHLFLFVCSPVFLPLGAMEWSMIVCDIAWSYSLVFVCL